MNRYNKDLEKKETDGDNSEDFAVVTETSKLMNDSDGTIAVNVVSLFGGGTDSVIEVQEKPVKSSNLIASKRARTRWFLAYTLIHNPVVSACLHYHIE